jgi:hypothetical protein
MRNILPFLFILVCPVMMLFMMRGMHGHGAKKDEQGHAGGQHGLLGSGDDSQVTELREQRAQLEARVEELETQVSRLAASPQHDAGVPTPV